MSDMKPSSADHSEIPAGDTPSARRDTKTRSKKSAKPARGAQAKAEQASAPEKTTPAYPVFDLSEEPAKLPAAVEESVSSGDWPEPEPATPGEASFPGSPKRGKRRRKKGKGGQPSNPQPAADEASAETREEPAAVETASPSPQPRPAHQPRPKLDSESVAKLAWKIYLSEVSEEGVALIGDNDARELSRRCFRLAEIFMEEQTRRR